MMPEFLPPSEHEARNRMLVSVSERAVELIDQYENLYPYHYQHAAYEDSLRPIEHGRAGPLLDTKDADFQVAYMSLAHARSQVKLSMQQRHNFVLPPGIASLSTAYAHAEFHEARFSDSDIRITQSRLFDGLDYARADVTTIETDVSRHEDRRQLTLVARNNVVVAAFFKPSQRDYPHITIEREPSLRELTECHVSLWQTRL